MLSWRNRNVVCVFSDDEMEGRGSSESEAEISKENNMVVVFCCVYGILLWIHLRIWMLIIFKLIGLDLSIAAHLEGSGHSTWC